MPVIHPVHAMPVESPYITTVKEESCPDEPNRPEWQGGGGAHLFCRHLSLEILAVCLFDLFHHPHLPLHRLQGMSGKGTMGPAEGEAELGDVRRLPGGKMPLGVEEHWLLFMSCVPIHPC